MPISGSEGLFRPMVELSPRPLGFFTTGPEIDSASHLGAYGKRLETHLTTSHLWPRVDVDLEDGLGKALRGGSVILLNGQRLAGVPDARAKELLSGVAAKAGTNAG